ncbi:fungal-specific transcription factor domain-containing protein [Aspergillus floccosus]
MTMSAEGRIRKRLPRSCRRCHRRKQRCVGYPICSNCEVAKLPCSRSETVPSWHHAMSKDSLVRRIEHLEAQLLSTRQGPSNGAWETTQSSRETERPEPHDNDPHKIRGIASSGPIHHSADGPPYLGLSSGLAMVENISRELHDLFWTKSIPVYTSYGSNSEEGYGDDQWKPIAPPDDAEGSKILHAYFEHIHIRLPFLRRKEILKLHRLRHDLVAPASEDRVGTFKLFLIYAIGSSILRMTETDINTVPEGFDRMARRFESALIASSWRDRAEMLMLLIVYHLRSSASSKVWHWLGQAMRICTDNGLHCKYHYQKIEPNEAQLRLRLFWSIYLVERYFCWSTGRPFSISESEIEADTPIDLESDIATLDDEMELTSIGESSAHHAVCDICTPSVVLVNPALRRFVACIQLQRITSVMKQHIYRANEDMSGLIPEISPFMTSLKQYEETLPPLSPGDHEFVKMHWNNCIRVLLQPFLAVLSPSDPLMQTCLSASGEICQSFRKLRQRGFGYSFLLANSIFVAGLTMCFCLLRSPNLWSNVASNDLRACSSAMSTMAEHNPNLKQHRDNLDVIIDKTTDYVQKVAVSRQNMLSARDCDLPESSEYLTGPHYPVCPDQGPARSDPSTAFVESYSLGVSTPQGLQDVNQEENGLGSLFWGGTLNLSAEDIDLGTQLDKLRSW